MAIEKTCRFYIFDCRDALFPARYEPGMTELCARQLKLNGGKIRGRRYCCDERSLFIDKEFPVIRLGYFCRYGQLHFRSEIFFVNIIYRSAKEEQR